MWRSLTRQALQNRRTTCQTTVNCDFARFSQTRGLARAAHGTVKVGAPWSSKVITASAEQPRTPISSRPSTSARSTHKQVLRGAVLAARSPPTREVSEAEFLDHKWQAKHSITNIAEAAGGAAAAWSSDEFVEDAQRGLRARADERARLALSAVAHRLGRTRTRIRCACSSSRSASRLLPDHPEARARLAARARRHAGRRADPPLRRQGAVPARSTPARSTAASARAATRSASTPKRWRSSSSRCTPSAGSRRFAYIALAPRARGHRHLGRRRLPAARRADHRDRRDAARASDHVRRMRFATKGPAVMPQKILTDDAWTDALTARRRARAQAAQGGGAPHPLQPPERDHRDHRRRR